MDPSGRRMFTGFQPLSRTLTSLLEVVGKMWATSTWESRRNNFRRMTEFAHQHGWDPISQIDYAGAMWVQSVRGTTIESSRLKYASEMSSIAARMGVQTPILRMLQSGLRASGALIPQKQAPPISLDQVRITAAAALEERLGEELHAAIFLAWKSASRYDEVSILWPRQITIISDKEILLSWIDRTKGSHKHPFRADSWTVVDHPEGIPERILRTLRAHAQRGPKAELIAHTTEWFERWLKKVLPDSEMTAHSYKAGALVYLLPAANPKHRLIQPVTLAILGKHLTPWAPLPDNTIRYTSREQLGTAEIMETQTATALLPW